MRNRWSMVFVALLGTVLLPRSATAVIQGSENAEPRADRLARNGRHREAAYWRQAAIELQERLSIPMFQEIWRSSGGTGEAPPGPEEARFYRKEVETRLARNRVALHRDLRLALQETPNPEAEARTLAEVEDYLLGWMLVYPDRFYRFGLYRQISADARALAAAGDPAGAVELEARARETCARQYRDILVRFLDERGNIYRKDGRTQRAERYAALSRHYSRLADMEVREAKALRTHSELVGDYLAHPERAIGSEPHPLIRRLRRLRMAILVRPASHLEVLDHADPVIRREAVFYLARRRTADGLLAAAFNELPAIRFAARSSLEAGLTGGDAALLHRLMLSLPLASHEQLALAHPLMTAYSRTPAPVPDRFGAGRDDAVREYWQRWWRRTLHPGVNASYYQDTLCHFPLTTSPAGLPGIEGATLPERVAAARWETIVTAPEDRIYLLSTRGRAETRAWLDGVPLAFTPDAATGSQVARLLLTGGSHSLRVEFAPGRDGPRDSRLALLPVDEGSGGAALRFERHVRPRPAGAALTAALYVSSRPGAAGAAAALAAALLALALGRRLARSAPARARAG